MSFPTTPGPHRRARTRTTKALLAAAAVALSGALATTGADADQPPGGDRAGEDETISVKAGTPSSTTTGRSSRSRTGPGRPWRAGVQPRQSAIA
jgi:hypothetical protein